MVLFDDIFILLTWIGYMDQSNKMFFLLSERMPNKIMYFLVSEQTASHSQSAGLNWNWIGC